MAVIGGLPQCDPRGQSLPACARGMALTSAMLHPGVEASTLRRFFLGNPSVHWQIGPCSVVRIRCRRRTPSGQVLSAVCLHASDAIPSVDLAHGIARTRADPSDFELNVGGEIKVFPNLGNDALLVVPTQQSGVDEQAYGHLANFVRCVAHFACSLLPLDPPPTSSVNAASPDSVHCLSFHTSSLPTLSPRPIRVASLKPATAKRCNVNQQRLFSARTCARDVVSCV